MPIRGRVARFVSRAGSWAMRPQTAMAALFLLAIGSSTLLLKGKKAPSSVVTVSDEGEPVASVAVTPSVVRPEAEHASDKPADLAKSEAKTMDLAPAASAMATAAAAAEVAKDESAPSLDGLSRGVPGRAPAPKPMPGLASNNGPSDDKNELNAAPVAGAPAGHGALGGYATGDVSGYATSPATAPMAPAPTKEAARGQFAAPPPPAAMAQGAGGAAAQPQQAPSAFAIAKAAYDAGDYPTALARFDALYAQTNDPQAELFAARSAVRVNGCTNDAVNRFEIVIAGASASRAGYDARLDEADCYRQMGDVTDARARLGQLLTVPSHMARAQAMLNALNANAKGGGGYASKARAAPAPAAPPPPQATPPAQQQAPQAAPPSATTQSY